LVITKLDLTEKCLSVTRNINQHIVTHIYFKNVSLATRSIDITYGHTRTNRSHVANTIIILLWPEPALTSVDRC